jgi:UDP-2,3-diacylglucosamine pyrophosphatase LpxH
MVCLSDIHFGEPYSLMWRNDLPLYAGKMVSYLAGGRIDKLMLVGDIWELAAPEEPDAAFPIARAFFQALTGDRQHGLELPEVIWVPGNHDHQLWTQYAQQVGAPLATTAGSTLWSGGKATNPAAEHLLTNLFGADVLERIGTMTVHNPFHVERFKLRTFIFHHGHYFDDLILAKNELNRFQARVSALVAGGWVAPNEPLKATDIADLERRCAPFIDRVWGRVTERQTLKSQSWELLTRFRSWNSCTATGAADTPQFAEIGNQEQQGQLPGDAENMRWFLRSFVLNDTTLADPLALVYGHFHRGGTFNLDVAGRTVSAINTGAWITSHAGSIPHSHVLLIDENGNYDERAVRFPDAVIDESVQHGLSVRSLDIPDFIGDAQSTEVSLL